MNKIKFFCYSLILLSSLILVYSFYKSEIIFNGNKRDYYFVYYLFGVLLFIFSVITFFLNQKLQEYIIISFLSIISSFYITEIYLYIDGISEKKKYLEKRYTTYNNLTGKIYDKRSMVEVYKDLKKQDNNIKVSVFPAYFLNNNEDNLFPLAGASLSKTIYCNDEGTYKIFDSDRHGFNNPDNEWDQKEIEYLIVGDSYGMGWCVDGPNDIGSVLRYISNNSVINLSYDSNGPLIEYSSLREYMPKNVKNVIWLYYEKNDLDNLHYELDDVILNKYLEDLSFSQNLKFKQEIIDKKISKTINDVFHSKIEKDDLFGKEKYFFKESLLLIKLSNLRGKMNKFLPKRYQPNYINKINPAFKEFSKILKLTKDLVSKNNANLFFVYLPEYSRYVDRKIFYKQHSERYDELKFRNYVTIKKIINELNIDFIDIHNEVFKKEANPLKLFPFELKGHYNTLGYKKTAETIFRFINN